MDCHGAYESSLPLFVQTVCGDGFPKYHSLNEVILKEVKGKAMDAAHDEMKVLLGNNCRLVVEDAMVGKALSIIQNQ